MVLSSEVQSIILPFLISSICFLLAMTAEPGMTAGCIFTAFV